MGSSSFNFRWAWLEAALLVRVSATCSRVLDLASFEFTTFEIRYVYHLIDSNIGMRQWDEK
jgi:hypothetical protein